MPNKPPAQPTAKPLSTIVPAEQKISPDIEDRRDWTPLQKALGQRGQDFKDYWIGVRQTYPDFHTAYKVILAAFQNKGNPSLPVNTPQAKPHAPIALPPRIGDTKVFPNGTTGIWDGHGWRLIHK